MPIDDRADVEQKPIEVDRSACTGPLAGPPDCRFYAPPDGCETQQVLDWGMLSVSMATNMPKEAKVRLINAYAVKWSIPLRVSHPDGSVTIEEPAPESFRP